jgi:hypothetical protein
MEISQRVALKRTENEVPSETLIWNVPAKLIHLLSSFYHGSWLTNAPVYGFWEDSALAVPFPLEYRGVWYLMERAE